MSGDRELWRLSATELADLVAQRAVSPVEVTEAVLRRAEQVEPRLNAFITRCAEPALEAARAAEIAVLAGGPLGPLHGVPFSVKDLLNTAGVRTTFGSFAFEAHVPARSAVAVERTLAAGGILIGKTATPEFGHKPLTEAPLFGRTANPWSAAHTCGGSSGGAAAAVAAGVGPIAIGTDGGGSIRIPAAACGIVGMKQTLGVVPHDQTADAFGLLAYIGPMSRTVADAALLLETMSGPHASDPHSHGRRVAGLRAAVAAAGDLEGTRIGYLERLGNERVDPATGERVRDGLSALTDAGAAVEPLTDDLPSTLAIWGPLTFSLWAQRFSGHEAGLGERMSASLRHWMAEGRAASALDVQGAMEARTTLYRHVEAWFERFDLIVTPTLARPAVPIDQDPLGAVEVDGAPAGGLREAWYPYTHPFNLTGHPAITLPAGSVPAAAGSPVELPVGLQIVGPWLADARVLAAAAVFERMRPWAERWPPEPA